MIPSAQGFTVGPRTPTVVHNCTIVRPALQLIALHSPHSCSAGGVCVRQSLQYDSGYCFLVGSNLNSTCSSGLGWVLQEGSGMSNTRSAGRIISCGLLPSIKLSDWHALSLAISSDGTSATIVANIDGTSIGRWDEAEPVKWRQGLVSLRSGFHYAMFDDLAIV